MKLLTGLLLAFLLVGCSVFSSSGEDDLDNRMPVVCSPEHVQPPCGGGVELGHEYRFNLLTHCGIEWAYFDGHYWVPNQNVDTPSDWEGVAPGTMALERRDLAVFEATKGGTVRFVTAPASYRPPNCE